MPEGEGYGTGGADDEVEAADWEPTELVGYLEEPPSAEERKLLTRRMFPSKVGGKPAWLIPQRLPELVCSKCSRPLRFLLQVYASRGSDTEGAFHRVLKLFICTSCQPNEVRAFRSQLPRENSFYSSDAPDPEQVAASAHSDPELEEIICWDCGLPCRTQPVSACVDDDVEEVPRADAVSNRCEECIRRFRNGDAAALLQERELTCCEAEEPSEPSDDEGGFEASTPEEADLEQAAATADAALALASPAQDAGDAAMLVKLEDFRNFATKDPEHAIDRSEQKIFDEWSKKEGHKDDVFSKFQSFSHCNDGHVIRHVFGGKPLWFAGPGRLNGEPPACPACGGPRHFELQVQPQLISLLEESQANESSGLVRRLDFGAVYVFVCKNSCSAGAETPYMEEFVHVQAEPQDAWLPK